MATVDEPPESSGPSPETVPETHTERPLAVVDEAAVTEATDRGERRGHVALWIAGTALVTIAVAVVLEKSISIVAAKQLGSEKSALRDCARGQ